MNLQEIKVDIKSLSTFFYTDQEKCLELLNTKFSMLEQVEYKVVLSPSFIYFLMQIDPSVFPQKSSSSAFQRCLSVNQIILTQNNLYDIFITLYEKISNGKPFTDSEDLSVLSTFFKEENVFAIYNLLKISIRTEDLWLSSVKLLLSLKEWLESNKSSNYSYPFLIRKICSLILNTTICDIHHREDQTNLIEDFHHKCLNSLDSDSSGDFIALEGNHQTISLKIIHLRSMIMKIQLYFYRKDYSSAANILQEALSLYKEVDKANDDLNSFTDSDDGNNKESTSTNFGNGKSSALIVNEIPLQVSVKKSIFQQLVFLQIQLFWKQEKYGECSKLLNNDSNWEEGKDSRVVASTMLGNLFFKLRKSNAAFLQFDKTLSSFLDVVPQFISSSSISQMSTLKYRQWVAKILLNIGLTVMKLNKYQEAFYYLASACFLSLNYLSQEMVLLRLSECCVQYDRSSKEELQTSSSFSRFPIGIQTLYSGEKQRQFLRYVLYIIFFFLYC
jgi:tetratricopeptide (TPR) repeat protein